MTGDSTDLPPVPAVDAALLAADTAAELRETADSLADEAVLEELAEAHPAEDAEAAGKGHVATEELANAVTWDIDVETFNSHARVQYYLDFFQGKGRERMGIWLTRMPRYEAMIRERLQRENLPGDLVYLALIESGFSNTATSRAKAVGMWQFMKATAKAYGLRVDSWVRTVPMRGSVTCRRSSVMPNAPVVNRHDKRARRLALNRGIRARPAMRLPSAAATLAQPVA